MSQMTKELLPRSDSELELPTLSSHGEKYPSKTMAPLALTSLEKAVSAILIGDGGMVGQPNIMHPPGREVSEAHDLTQVNTIDLPYKIGTPYSLALIKYATLQLQVMHILVDLKKRSGLKFIYFMFLLLSSQFNGGVYF